MENIFKNIDEIKNINFESDEISAEFDKINLENNLIFESIKLSKSDLDRVYY